MEKEILLVTRRKNELESRYSDFRSKGLNTAELEAEARQLLAYEQHLLTSIAAATTTTSGGGGGINPLSTTNTTSSDTPTILCCHCGVLTEVNDARACYNCISNRATIVDQISENNSVTYCKSCERYEFKPNHWLLCEWESKELLALCLKRIKKPKSVRLVDAEFIWTEPHSRRIRLRVTFEGESGNVTLRQAKDVTFVMSHRQCEECCKSVTPHIWVSSLQVRQRCEFKRSMLYLEQLVLKHQAHKECSNIIDIKDGLDFHFLKPQHAQTLCQFIRSHICCKVFPIATQLVSHDANSNVYRNKYTQIIEICPINREDLVFISKKQSQKLGGISQILLCDKIRSGVKLIDPFSRQIVDIDAERFFKLTGLASATGASSGASGGYVINKSSPQNSIRTIVNSSSVNHTEFIVLNITPLQSAGEGMSGGGGGGGGGVRKIIGRVDESYKLTELELCKCSDFGKKDKYITTVTHLGGIIKIGDVVLAYDLSSANISSDDDPDLNDAIENLPYEVIVVKKQTAKKRREWEFQILPREYMASNASRAHQAAVAEADRLAIEEDMVEMAECLAKLDIE